jgi:glycine/sarcosine N-methyltransferase
MSDSSKGGSPEETVSPAPAADYDQFVDWQRRLAREAPFFSKVFKDVGARTVIDVGAGSARHAIMFATWGLEVVAVDPSDSMLARAEQNIAQRAQEVAEAGGSVQLLRGSFGGLEALGLGPVDVLTCTGNALPHVEGRRGLRAALADFAAVVREGGVIVLHLLNHAGLLKAQPRTIAPVFRETPEGDKVYLRVIGYPDGGEYLDFDFVTLLRDMGGEWTLTNRRSMHTALPLSLLERDLTAAGFEDTQAFGGHDGRSFDVDADESLILTARRAS